MSESHCHGVRPLEITIIPNPLGVNDAPRLRFEQRLKPGEFPRLVPDERHAVGTQVQDHSSEVRVDVSLMYSRPILFGFVRRSVERAFIAEAQLFGADSFN